MTRHLFWAALVLTLSASFLGLQFRATAQESADTPAAGTADQGDASVGQSDTSSSGQTESSSQPASSGTPDHAGNQSESGNASSKQSESEPASRSEETTSPQTSPAKGDEKDSIDNKSQSALGSPTDARTVPSPKRPGIGDTDQSIQKDRVTPNRDQADVSVQGRANSDRRAERRSHHDFKRGLQFGQMTNRGLAIGVVEQDSIYYRSGFRRGDVIISLYGRPVRSQADFMRFIVMHPGQRVPVIVLRDGRRHTIHVEYPQEVVHTHIYDNRSGSAYLGVLFDARVRDAAMVLSVSPGSPAETAGMRQGDTILAMNGQEIQSYPEVISMIRSMRPGQEVDIVIRRGQSDTQVFAVLGAQANVRTATRPSDIHVEHHTVPADQPAGVQIELNRRGNNGRLLERDRNSDGNPGRPLLPRLRD
jgi:S1-C subfamily serine protease